MDEIEFCTLGMFIIDEIEFEPPRPPVKDIIGGAGSYAVAGARIVAGREGANRVGWVVDTGTDFSHHVRDTISSWETYCVMREHPDRLTTRAWNGYGVNEQRDFKYLTPKIRLDHNSLPIPLIFSKSFHMVCSAARCRQIVEGILERRMDLLQAGHSPQTSATQRPLFVWEPVPNLCCPEELAALYDATSLVDVVSPNDSELAAYFGRSTWEGDNPTDEKLARTVTHAGGGMGPHGTGVLVVRAGKHGCYAFSKDKSLRLPACQGIDVIDPTGAGNAFLGALAETLVSSREQYFSGIINSSFGQSRMWLDVCDSWASMHRLPSALVCATISASFVIEQVGMPSVSESASGEEESWNGAAYTNRLREYAKMLKDTFENQESDLRGGN